jgi:hypothetical protein
MGAIQKTTTADPQQPQKVAAARSLLAGDDVGY